MQTCAILGILPFQISAEPTVGLVETLLPPFVVSSSEHLLSSVTSLPKTFLARFAARLSRPHSHAPGPSVSAWTIPQT